MISCQNYTIKVINVNHKSQYTIQKFRSSNRFSSVHSLQDYITKQIQEEAIDIGFIEPGHGMKGKQTWILEDDLTNMYSRLRNKKDVVLWCHVRKNDEDPSTSISSAEKNSKTNTRKRPLRMPDPLKDKVPQSKRETCAQKINEVEDIVKNKHGTLYSIEKLNTYCKT